MLRELGLGFSILLIWVTTAFAQDIPLAPGDEIEIAFYGREDLSGRHVIDVTGTVALPLLGRLGIGGLPAAKVEQMLLNVVEESGLATDPSVIVQVLRRADVFVGGSVATPGAYTWTPELTVGQAMVLAGGPRNRAFDEIGNVLTAYRSAEELSALTLRIAGLQARKARLLAEIAMAVAAFAQDPVAGATALDMLDLTKLEALVSAPSANDTIAAFAALDTEAQQAVWAELAGQQLIRFPAAIADDPQLSTLRRTHNAHLHDWIATNLAAYSSLQRQATATSELLVALRARSDIVENTISALDARLKDILALKQGGLVRVNDVLSAQTALSEATSTQLEIVDAIINAEVLRYGLSLSLENFMGGLRLEVADQVEAVLTQLIEARGRLGAVRQAAEISALYRDGTTEQTGSAVTFELVRRASFGTVAATITSGTPLMPGDMLVVSPLTD